MRNFRRELNDLMHDFDNMEYDDLDDFAVEQMSNEPLDELLFERGITFEQALCEERKDREYYRQIAIKCGFFEFEPPLVWYETVKLCKENYSEECFRILLWLLAGGRFSENIDEELGDGFTVRRWLGITERAREYSNYLETYKRSREKYSDIIQRINSAKLNSPKFFETDGELVFSLLCENGFADDCESREVLLDNLKELDGVIAANVFLTPIKPLIYFLTYIRHRQKLLNKQAFSPNFKNLFEYKGYGISSDNGKNYAQYADYCDLYARLKTLFSDVDRDTCDIGFIQYSNLADWYWSLPDMGYECDIPDGVPLTLDRFVEDMCVTCFDELPEFAENIGKLRKQYPTLQRAVQNAVRALTFDELPTFAADPRKFSDRYFAGELLKGLNGNNLNAAWQLLIDQTRRGFDVLLYNEVLGVLNEYIQG